MIEGPILVVGATGTQGGAVVRALRERTEFPVRGLTRDPSSPRARALEDAGVSVVQGDLGNADRLRELLDDVDAVFGVTDFWEHGYDAEVEQGLNLVDAAADVGIEHLVFSSVGGAERDAGVPHFDSKYEIERRIREHGLPATIVRPVFFMQNFEGMQEQILEGQLAFGLERRVPLQLLDVENLGAFVAEAFLHPGDYLGEAYELAGDELTLQATAARLSDVTERAIDAVHLSIDEMRNAMGEEYAVMARWFNDEGYEADLSSLRREHRVPWTRLETYLEREGWGKIAE